MPEHVPETYNRRQRLAHWLVVALVAVQLASGDRMARAYAAASEAGAWGQRDAGATLHGATGLAILGLMLWRVSLRRRHGAPPPPAELSPTLRMVSRANHFAFYAVLIAMPLVGFVAAWTLDDSLAILHASTAPVLVFLVAAHVLGALYHAATPGSKVFRRMIGPLEAKAAKAR